MEKTVINIKTNKDLKLEAQEVAKDLGLPLGTLINAYLRDLVHERRAVFTTHPMPNNKTKRILDKALNDVREGNVKEFSPVFNNAKEAMVWLDK